MMSTFFVLVVLVFLSVAFGLGGMAGGWSDVSQPDLNKDVRKASAWAARQKFPDASRMDVKVLKAQKQVVAGMKYRMLVAVAHDGSCEKYDFDVWDRFGQLTLAEVKNVEGNC